MCHKVSHNVQILVSNLNQQLYHSTERWRSSDGYKEVNADTGKSRELMLGDD